MLEAGKEEEEEEEEEKKKVQEGKGVQLEEGEAEG